MRREGVEAAGDAVVETRADVHHDIAVMHDHVGLVRAVHAEHADPVFAGGRIGAEAHQGGRDRHAGQSNQLAQQLRGFRARINDAAAGIDDRLFGREYETCRSLDPFEVAFHPRMIALALNSGGGRVQAFGELHVLWNINDDRARTSCCGDVEGFVQDARQVIDIADQPIVLGAGPCDADCVAFLESIRADQKRRDLAGEADERN